MQSAHRRALAYAIVTLGTLTLASLPSGREARSVGLSVTAAAPVEILNGTTATVTGFSVGGVANTVVTVTATPAGTITLACGATCAGVRYEVGDGVEDATVRLHGPTAEVNTAIATLVVGAPPDAVTTVSVAADDGGIPHDHATGHFYRWVPGPVTWPEARQAALAATHEGLTGYLATITSAEENSTLEGYLGAGSAFIGVSDLALAGSWRWVDGPDAGVGMGPFQDFVPWPITSGRVGVFVVDLSTTPPYRAWRTVSETLSCCGYLIEFGGAGTYAPPTATATVTASANPPTSSTSTTTSTAPTTTVPARPVTPASTTTSTSTTTTSTTSTTTVPAPDPGDGSGGGSGDGGAAPSSNWRARIALDAAIGDPVLEATVRLVGEGLRPGADVEAGVRSEYTVLATGRTAADGSFSFDGRLPALEPGEHTIELRYVGAAEVLDSARFVVGPDGRLESADERLGVPTNPSGDTGQLLVLGVAALTLIGVAGSTSSPSSTSSTTSEGESEDEDSGSVSTLDQARRTADLDGEGWGDRSRTWHSPGTALLDRWSPWLTRRLAPLSPMWSHAVDDGATLRAMVGSVAVLPTLAAAVLGVVAARSTGFESLAPGHLLLGAVIVLATLDLLNGMLAGTIYVLLVAAGGGIDSLDALLTAAGVFVAMVAAPVIAAATRPLSRRPDPSPFGRWDRGADVVLAALLSGWAVQSMIGGLPGLRGRSLPIADHADALALLAMAAVAVRIALESLAANAYPQRLERVDCDDIPEPAEWRIALTRVGRLVMLGFASQRFIGTNGWLWGGLAIAALPDLLGPLSDRFPRSTTLHRALPRGVVKVVVMLVVGGLWGAFVQDVATGETALRLGFVLLPLPGLVLSLLALFAAPASRPPIGWWHRLAGLGLTVFGVLLATGRLW